MANRWSMMLTAAMVLAASPIWAADKKVQMKDLPPAVPKAVQAETHGATIIGLAKEEENDKTFYEAETKVNGRTRDILFDATGKIVNVEEEVTLDSIPAAAKAAITAAGKVLRLETQTKGTTVTYEAQIEKNGKKSEIVVDASGKRVKS